MNTYSCVILSCNEKDILIRNINNCRKYSFINEILVIDDYSDDGTKEFLIKEGIPCIQNHFESPLKQRMVANGYVNNNWVIFLDADEFISDELADYLRLEDLDPNIEYLFLRHNIVFNKILYFGGWYPDYQERLKYIYDKTKIQKQVITAPLYHFSHNTISEWWRKYVRSTSNIAQNKIGKYNRKTKIKDIFVMIFQYQGYKDGIVGIITIFYLYLFEWTIFFKRIWYSHK